MSSREVVETGSAPMCCVCLEHLPEGFVLPFAPRAQFDFEGKSEIP